MSLTKALIYFVSSLFMFFAGNMNHWLLPWLISHGTPDWITGSASFFGFTFVFATLLNMWFVSSATPKESSALKDNEKQKIIKKEQGRHNKTVRSLKNAHEKELAEKLTSEGVKIRGECDNKIKNLEDESNNKQVTIDVLSTELVKVKQGGAFYNHPPSPPPENKKTPDVRNNSQIDINNEMFSSAKEG